MFQGEGANKTKLSLPRIAIEVDLENTSLNNIWKRTKGPNMTDET